jgi:hypothetical protein
MVWAVLLGARPAFADTGNADKVLAVGRAAAPPIIDGRLDEPAWAAAAPEARFVQVFPHEGGAPTERTEVRVLYDDTAVYVGIRCLDSAAQGIVARMTRRDRDIETDAVAIAIDSQQDRRTAFLFQLSAAGVQLDGMFYDDQNLNLDWDAVWDGATSVDAQGWTAELRIPLSVLRFSDGPVQDWGFQVMRNITRKKEKDLWAFHPVTVQGEVSWFGRLGGLTGLARVRPFELRPFVVARVSGRTATGSSFFSRGSGTDGRILATPDLGVDAKLGVTSRLVLDATANPDFGQVEADQVELNLSRFESFFPEKRPFFLEGADVYRTPLQLFYSRRIGQPPNRLGRGDTIERPDGELTVTEPRPSLRIWSAGKLTGAVTRNLSIGVLGAVTAAEVVDATDAAGQTRTVRLAPERSFSVVRARYSLGPRAYVGVLGTAVNRLRGALYLARHDHDAYTQGLDAYWQSRGGSYRLNGQVVLSERSGGPAHEDDNGLACQPGAPGCRPLYRLDGTTLPPGSVGVGGASELQVRDGHLTMNARLQSLSSRLDVNDAGFVQRWNEHSLGGAAGYFENRPTGPFQNFGVFPFANTAFTSDGVNQQSVVGLHLEGQLRSFFSSNPEVAVVLPGAWDIFETGDGARLQKIGGINPSWWLSTDGRKAFRVSGSAWAFLGPGGSRAAGGNADASYQVSARLQLELSPGVGHDWQALRFHDCTAPGGGGCTAATLDRFYHFARLDSSYLSLTTRGTYTLSPRLSLQWYGQLFLARGEFGRFTEVATTGQHPFIHRADLQPSAFRGDADGDGSKDKDFQNASVNVNAVLRWELHPGSALYVVYTRAQAADVTLGGRSPRYTLRGLETGATEDVFLVKLSYFLR